MPRVWRSHPTLRLTVVGADPTPGVSALAGPRVEIVGRVRDPRPWLDRARLHVAPLRIGAGIRLRLIETMAAGLPFVTTPIGAEGLGLDDLTPVLVGETPSDLARLVRSLHDRSDLWEHAQTRLLELARTRFGRERFRATLVEAMVGFGVAPPPPTRPDSSELAAALWASPWAS